MNAPNGGLNLSDEEDEEEDDDSDDDDDDFHDAQQMHFIDFSYPYSIVVSFGASGASGGVCGGCCFAGVLMFFINICKTQLYLMTHF